MEVEASAWLIVLDKAMLPLVVLILTPLLTALANRAIAALQEKTKIRISAERKADLYRAIEEGIYFVEEQAHKAIKNKTGELDGDSKMELAIDYVQKKAAVLGLDDLAEAKSDDLAALIEAQLFRKRINDFEPTIEAPATLTEDKENEKSNG